MTAPENSRPGQAPPPLRGLYNIAPGLPFARALAHGLLTHQARGGAVLADWHVFLPTRRACRALADSFLQLSGGRPLLLPRLQPLGDIEEDELALNLAAGDDSLAATVLAMKPALSPLRRQVLLARAIAALPAYSRGAAQDFALAGALGRLMDQVYTEGLDLAALPGLVADRELAKHWEVSVTFLEILSRTWPQILAAEGAIDAADRRGRLMAALCAHWERTPPPGPVLAAGSTGSIPATARLLGLIAALPQGCVVLPGLDRAIDPASWDALDDSHPQATLRRLLQRLGAAPSDVAPWPFTPPTGEHDDAPPALTERRRAAREWLAREAMRPAATSQVWQTLGHNPDAAAPPSETVADSLTPVLRLTCGTPQDEALLIAMLMRGTLESPGRTAALVTPDRTLARRVATICARWGVEIDDSGGQPLSQTALGGFLRLIVQCADEGFRPGLLAALLKHDLTRLGRDRATLRAAAAGLETTVLRGPLPGAGFAALHRRAADRSAEGQRTDKTGMALLHELEQAFAPLSALPAVDGENRGALYEFAALARAHLAVAEALAATPETDGAAALWIGPAGEAAAALFAELLAQEQTLCPAGAEDYLAILTQLMGGVNVRPAFGTHPRLSILGQLEARLTQPDLTILAGLNEGIWPPTESADPWMSRPMRAAFGLPSPERAIGLAAHDFVQAFCAPQVVVTRARRNDGAPAVPARWLARLDTVLGALGIGLPGDGAQWEHWAALIDAPPGPPKPCGRPAPRPPAAVRPESLHVTAIERWMRDPYSLYARYILKLRPLDELEESADAAVRGTMMHKVLDRFVADHPGDLPADARERLTALGADMLARDLENPRLWGFWWPRFETLAGWFVDHERQWRRRATPVATETEGAAMLMIDGRLFTLKARADRIDRMKLPGAPSYAVIDYKTGAAPPKKQVESGFSPQLPLEALILGEGGFAGLPAAATGYMGFWRLTGSAALPGEEHDVTCDGEAARAGLTGLIRAFRRADTPYLSLPRPDKAPAFQDYAHLARVREWTALDESEEAS